MKYKLSTTLTTLLIFSTIIGYQELNKKQEHFNNLKNYPYILTILINSLDKPMITAQLKQSLEKIDVKEPITNDNVLLEFIDTSAVPFFDKHYKLEGKSAAKLFIRNQMINYENFDSYISNIQISDKKANELSMRLLEFVDLHLKNISVEIRDIDHFWEVLNSNKIIGYYCGNQDANFNQYYNVASKNIDFYFTHSFDTNLCESIFREIGQINSHKPPFFAIIRSKEALNEFDNNPIVVFTDFSEKALSEFIEFERFDKLRDPADIKNIIKRMFNKAQPLLLYVKDNSQTEKNFKNYMEAVKVLPKNFIYSYTDVNSGEFLQLFVMAHKMMTVGTLSILWVTPTRNVRVENYQGALEKEMIIEFVSKFNKQNERIIDSMRAHLYDKENKVRNQSIASEEL